MEPTVPHWKPPPWIHMRTAVFCFLLTLGTQMLAVKQSSDSGMPMPWPPDSFKNSILDGAIFWTHASLKFVALKIVVRLAGSVEASQRCADAYGTPRNWRTFEVAIEPDTGPCWVFTTAPLLESAPGSAPKTCQLQIKANSNAILPRYFML